MKALTVKNPWAWLIIHCGKDVENRTWDTGYRGRILIHASKKPESFGDSLAALPKGYGFFDTIRLRAEADESNGCIIGSAEIVDCVQDAKSPWAEPGMRHWILKNPIPFAEPIPAKGKPGLWDFDEADGFVKTGEPGLWV